MTIRFTARDVGVEEDLELECLTAGLAEAGENGMVLLFMCDLAEPDEQDAALGLDTHCVVTADQGTAYGAVEAAVLRGKVLHLTVAAGSLEALRLDDREIEAFLDVEDDLVERFRAALRRVLAYGRPDARPAVVEL